VEWLPLAVSTTAACPCINHMSRCVIRGPLTYELAQKDSPIRQFFNDRLSNLVPVRR
jgi:hypothetical protein